MEEWYSASGRIPHHLFTTFLVCLSSKDFTGVTVIPSPRETLGTILLSGEFQLNSQHLAKDSLDEVMKIKLIKTPKKICFLEHTHIVSRNQF